MSTHKKNRHKRASVFFVLAFLILGFSGVSLKVFAEETPEQLKQDRDQFIKEIRRVENLNRKYTQDLDDVRSQMGGQQQDFESRMKLLEDKIEMQKQKVSPQIADSLPPHGITAEMEEKTNEILTKGGDLDPEDEKFREELAKAHYNMGNIFYERGEYQRAVVEYFQAVDLLPYDADIHYNLAFVSSEFLGDQDTALKHYQWYLYLKPEAEDASLVREKILAAKLFLRAKIDTFIDKDFNQFNVTR